MVPLSDVDPSKLIVILTNFLSKETLTVDIILLVVILFCIIMSAFFSAIETAMSSSSLLRLHTLADEKVKGARKAIALAENFDKTVTAILIGNNIVNIGASTIAGYIFVRVVSNASLAGIISTAVMTFLILTFGEILPKTFAKKNGERFFVKVAPMMWVLTKIFTPLTLMFVGIKKLFSLKKKETPQEATVTGEELEKLVDVMEDEGVIDEEHADLIQSALLLDKISVYDIMTPRIDMIAVDVNASFDEIIHTFDEFQYSRIPVYEKDKDNIIGVLAEKDFLIQIVKNKGNYDKIDIRDLISEPYYVNKSTKVDDLIANMQQIKKHFAIVIDEYGGTSGIVTMEDALEELVGEIYDEYDEVDADLLTEVSENHYKVSPEMPLIDLYEELNLGNAPESNYSLVGGYLYHEIEELPKAGQVVTLTHVKEEYSGDKGLKTTYKLIFTIEKVQKRRIIQLDLKVEIESEETI